ncbi:unnamed protein product [Jaminaea pallidilutea]
MASLISQINIPVPVGYGYVGLALLGVPYLNLAQIILVNKARKASGIPYPQLYADKAEAKASNKAHKFNCVQRAHQNTLESLPSYAISLIVAGLRFPRLAAGLGATWLIGRVLYTIGYSSGDPSARTKGAIPSSLALISLQIAATVGVVQHLMETDWKI